MKSVSYDRPHYLVEGDMLYIRDKDFMQRVKELHGNRQNTMRDIAKALGVTETRTDRLCRWLRERGEIKSRKPIKRNKTYSYIAGSEAEAELAVRAVRNESVLKNTGISLILQNPEMRRRVREVKSASNHYYTMDGEIADFMTIHAEWKLAEERHRTKVMEQGFVNMTATNENMRQRLQMIDGRYVLDGKHASYDKAMSEWKKSEIRIIAKKAGKKHEE